ncbi:hypothetical protein BJX63DRAFT_409778 [Aspergillus granulosus]|uniref:Uncharacterized protein n=1 Tax=Aspergillus granulosus TaxID=176169 RepID=A0ABR4GYM8_9EURO
MRFTQILAFVALGVLVPATAKPWSLDAQALEAFEQLDNPEAFKVFMGVLDGEFPPTARRDTELEKRQNCCSGPCCESGDDCDPNPDVTYCLWNCANIPSAGGQAGCIAGCWVACG